MSPTWIAAAGDLLLGASCLGCGRPWWGTCPRCRAEVSSRACRLVRPEPEPDGFPLTVAAGPYDEIVQRLIHSHKEDQGLAAAGLLAARLAASVEVLLAAYALPLDRPVLLVPVPSAPAVVRQRGYDATAAMARRASHLLRRARPVRSRRLLTPARRLRDQAGLSAEDRLANLRGGYRLRASPPTAAVILVDDVVTTGASLTEAARALTVRGVEVLGAATVAATVRRLPPGPVTPATPRSGAN